MSVDLGPWDVILVFAPGGTIVHVIRAVRVVLKVKKGLEDTADPNKLRRNQLKNEESVWRQWAEDLVRGANDPAPGQFVGDALKQEFVFLGSGNVWWWSPAMWRRDP